MENMFEMLADLQKTGTPAALAIVMRTEGSVPRKPGTKMIIFGDGKLLELLEGVTSKTKVIEQALESIREGTPRIATFTLDMEKGKLDMMCAVVR